MQNRNLLFLLLSGYLLNTECLPMGYQATESQGSKKMPAARCGDTNNIKSRRGKRFATIYQGWQKRHLTYHITNWSPRLSEEIVARNVRKALDIWGRHGNLTFSRSLSPDADIKLSFLSKDHGDSQPFDGPGLVLAHTFYPGDTQFPGSAGDVHFDNDELWTDFSTSDPTQQQDGKDFFTVALHELGHSLGLSESNVESAIMYGLYRGDNVPTDLDYDDIMGIRELYVNKILNEDKPSTEAPMIVQPQRPHYRTRIKRLFRHRNNPVHNSDAIQPNICQGHFDTVAILREDLYIFRNEYIWRLDSDAQMYPGYPLKIRQVFPDISEDIRHIDAAYQRPNGNMVLFTGKQLWIHNGNRFVEGSPLPLDYYGGLDLDGIDAIYNSEKNGKTYIFKNRQYWIFDENKKQMDYGDPKPIKNLGAVGLANLDAVFTWTDGITYFLKDDFIWMLENDKIAETKPLRMPRQWLGCKEQVPHSTKKPSLRKKFNNSENAKSALLANVFLLISTYFFIYLVF